MHSSYDTRTERLHFIGLLQEVIRLSYYSLPTIITLSVVWCVASLTIVFAAPMWAVVVDVVRHVVEKKTLTSHTVLGAFRRYFWQSQAAFVPFFVFLNITSWLWLSATQSDSLLSGLLFFFSLDVLVLYCYLMIYYFQLLTEDSIRGSSENGVLGESVATARKSAVVAVSEVRTTVGLFLLSLSIAVLLGFTVAGFVTVAPGVIALTLILASNYISSVD